jgi:probable HAF family extracellular repeat protein
VALVVAGALGVVAPTPAVATATPTLPRGYRVVELGPDTWLYGLSERGHATFECDEPSAGAPRAFRWWRGRETPLTPDLPYGAASRPMGMNDRGDVTGSSEVTPGVFHAFRWRNGRMHDLGTLGGPSSYGLGINERGDVVGASETADGKVHAVLWRNGRIYDLGGSSFVGSFAGIINDRGQILGYLDGRAVLWNPASTR